MVGIMQDSAAVLPSPFAHGSRSGGFDEDRLLAPAQAVIAYFARAAIGPVGTERVALASACDRILASDAVAREDHPSHRRSTMDGFAVASADGAAPRRLAGEVLMGAPPPRAIGPGETLRVPTGGAIPDGADAVVPQEDTTAQGELITPEGLVRPGDFITQRAEDIAAGETVLRAGRRIGGPELGVLATLGFAEVEVYRRPVVGIISTGDELVDPASVPALGQIRDSNRYAIAGALAAFGAQPVQLPRAADTPEALRAVLAAGLAACDAVVTTGGSSVGARDLVPQIVGEFGAPGAIVHGVRVKPGKPTLLAAVGPKPVIGLPGNPTSSLMILEAIVRPIIAALVGECGAAPTVLEAIAGAEFRGRPGWTWFVPARLVARGATLYAEPFTIRSAQTSLLARASGYVAVGESAVDGETAGDSEAAGAGDKASRTGIPAGSRVRVALFSCGGAPIVAERS
jgi:molybdenum cofactor synthesis domain-containing protein